MWKLLRRIKGEKPVTEETKPETPVTEQPAGPATTPPVVAEQTSAEAPASATEAAVEQPPAEGMRRCITCGVWHAAGERACPNCNTPQPVR